jgi:hypothetical protein
MNLKWANFGALYFPMIVPGMGKHCDLGHIVDPSLRNRLAHENAPNLALTAEQTSLAFDLIAVPNHRGHIIGPGRYKLDIFVAAENAPRIARTIELSLGGSWHADEARMLRDGVGVTVLKLNHAVLPVRRPALRAPLARTAAIDLESGEGSTTGIEMSKHNMKFTDSPHDAPACLGVAIARGQD